jgi:hypothetical protein
MLKSQRIVNLQNVDIQTKRPTQQTMNEQKMRDESQRFSKIKRVQFLPTNHFVQVSELTVTFKT